MRAAEFATRVAQARRHGDHYAACCPAHEDRSPSLTFRDGQRGLLMHCWAGCDVVEIARAVGVGVADLFFSPGEQEWPARRRRSPQPETRQQAWRRVWTGALRDAEAEGRHWAVWDPIYARADFVRHAYRLAQVYRGRATAMGPDDPAVWDEAALAVMVEDEARLVEIDADELTAVARWPLS
jgi:hypothetical protein